jgi:hypothetical protein
MRSNSGRLRVAVLMTTRGGGGQVVAGRKQARQPLKNSTYKLRGRKDNPTIFGGLWQALWVSHSYRQASEATLIFRDREPQNPGVSRPPTYNRPFREPNPAHLFRLYRLFRAWGRHSCLPEKVAFVQTVADKNVCPTDLSLQPARQLPRRRQPYDRGRHNRRMVPNLGQCFGRRLTI